MIRNFVDIIKSKNIIDSKITISFVDSVYVIQRVNETEIILDCDDNVIINIIGDRGPEGKMRKISISDNLFEFEKFAIFKYTCDYNRIDINIPRDEKTIKTINICDKTHNNKFYSIY